MNSDQMLSAVMSAIDTKVINICEIVKNKFVSYIKYEFTITNMELAAKTKKHGYNFKTLPDSLIEQIQTDVSRTTEGYAVNIRIGPESFKDADESIVDFFKEYVIKNAQERLTYGVM